MCGERKDLLIFQNIQAHQSVGVMAWVCMVASGTGSLIFIDDVTHNASSRMNSEVSFCLPIYKDMYTVLLGGDLSCSKIQNTLPTQRHVHLEVHLGVGRWRGTGDLRLIWVNIRVTVNTGKY